MIRTYLSFTICGEHYAVNVAKVLKVLQEERITHVPNSPVFIRGIINFRGEVVPVFETRIRVNLPERANTDAYNIIVLDISEDTEKFRLGALVDKVKEVISIDDADIKPVPVMYKEFNTNFLQGIYKLDNDFIMILNVERVFTGQELNAVKVINVEI